MYKEFWLRSKEIRWETKGQIVIILKLSLRKQIVRMSCVRVGFTGKLCGDSNDNIFQTVEYLSADLYQKVRYDKKKLNLAEECKD